MDDFRMLIAEAGKLGLEIALDLAFQCAPDHPYVSEHPEWFAWRPDGTVQYAENPPKKYEDILPFHFETEHWESLWRELKSIVDYWIDAGVRIFRVDNPHTKPFRFWEWLIREVRKKHPQVIFLAEAFTRPRVMERLAQVGFSQSYTYFTWRNTPQELEAYMRELVDTDMRYYFRPNFWPNTPDILPPVLSEGGENAHIIRLVLAATLSSSYGIYGPVYELEWRVPMPGKEEYIDNEKYEIRFWDWNLRTRLGELITRINRIRREHTAFHSTWNLRFAHSTDNHILCYIKADPIIGNRLIVVVNTDPFQTHSGEVQITPELLGMEERQDYTVRDLLSGDVWQWGEWNYVSLDPYRMPAHILLVDDKTTAG
jgi:starch synthase (maltosyl-transferring)